MNDNLINSFYNVSTKDLGDEINLKAKDFSEKVVGETYDRFSYSQKRRAEVISIGKLAEEVFVRFAKEKLNISLKVNYDIYPGVNNVDANDFNINGFEIDIKSSKDTKNEGIISCYSRFNFPVPVGQDMKDITISILYDYNVTNFYIVSWIDKTTYLEKAQIRDLPVGNGITRKFYLCPLTLGKDISCLKDYLGI